MLAVMEFYRSYVNFLPERIAPLYKLLGSNVPWTWGVDQKSLYDQVRSEIVFSATEQRKGLSPSLERCMTAFHIPKVSITMLPAAHKSLHHESETGV
jgi:hypothetical protein